MSFYGRYNQYQKRTPAQVKQDPNLVIRIEAIASESSLNEVTRNFVNSLHDFCKKNGGLTEKQLAAFSKVESRFSPQEKVKLKNWEQEYKSKYFEDAKIIASYYSTKNFFRFEAEGILNDEDYVPSASRWRKMSENHYAQKILEETKRDPKFPNDSMVQVRSTVGKDPASRFLKKLKNRLGFVIETNLAASSPVNGGKRYQILPMGHATPVFLEERHIMKPNKNGVSTS
jgi:hypothetical protein